MILEKEEVIKVAESHLNAVITNNNYSDLGLPKRADELFKSDWNIHFSEKLESYTIPIYTAIVNFLSKKLTIATYKLYLSDNLEFVDEFFIIHDQNDD